MAYISGRLYKWNGIGLYKRWLIFGSAYIRLGLYKPRLMDAKGVQGEQFLGVTHFALAVPLLQLSRTHGNRLFVQSTPYCNPAVPQSGDFVASVILGAAFPRKRGGIELRPLVVTSPSR